MMTTMHDETNKCLCELSEEVARAVGKLSLESEGLARDFGTAILDIPDDTLNVRTEMGLRSADGNSGVKYLN